MGNNQITKFGAVIASHHSITDYFLYVIFYLCIEYHDLCDVLMLYGAQTSVML